MKKGTGVQNERLQEIAATPLGALSDEEVARLLAERTHLLEQSLKHLEQEISELRPAPQAKLPVSEPVKEVFVPAPSSPLSLFRQQFGPEGIQKSDIVEESELHRYMDQLKGNTGSLGALLQDMPLGAKRNKAFMLKVAQIDPAYAMHFADKDTLKKDEDFNIRVASIKNPRHSGNALAEMLPEARTAKVIMAAVKQDYLNVKFLRPAMENYERILSIAKKEALEKIKELQDATDVLLLIPQILQQDAAFMEKVQSIVATGKEKQPPVFQYKENKVYV